MAKRAIAKGRSSARALRPALLRACAYDVAGNLHHSLGIAPTRLNTADAPTRERPLLQSSSHSILEVLSSDQLIAILPTSSPELLQGGCGFTFFAAFCLCPGEGHWISGYQTSFHPSGFSCTMPWILTAILLGFICQHLTISWIFPVGPCNGYHPIWISVAS